MQVISFSSRSVFWTRSQEIISTFVSHLITRCTHDPPPGGGKSSFFFASQTLVFAAQEHLIIDSAIGLRECVMLPFQPLKEIFV